MKAFSFTAILVLGGGACAAAGAAVTAAASHSCHSSPLSPLDDDLCDVLLRDSDGENRVSTPAYSGTWGLAPAQFFPSPDITSRCSSALRAIGAAVVAAALFPALVPASHKSLSVPTAVGQTDDTALSCVATPKL